MANTNLQTPFQTQPTAIASFDFTDIISGKAFKTFYGGKTEVGGNFMSTTPLNSDYQQITTESAGFTSASGVAKRIDEDFDTTFDVPQTVSGGCVINVTSGMRSSDGAGVDHLLIVQALKNGVHLVSGGTTYHTLEGGSLDVRSHEHSIFLDIPETTFAIGDTLRFTYEVWAAETVGGGKTAVVSIAHDGSNRADDKSPISISGAHATKMTMTPSFVPNI